LWLAADKIRLCFDHFAVSSLAIAKKNSQAALAMVLHEQCGDQNHLQQDNEKTPIAASG
jgi:hypothetical protein